jgi:hypothetical protein
MTMTARSMAQKSFERRRTQAPTISQVRNNLPLALFPSCALDVFEHSLDIAVVPEQKLLLGRLQSC